MDVKLLERPTSAPISTVSSLDRQAAMAYRDAAAAVGVVNPDIAIDEFQHFLAERDLPVFNLGAVSRFMDDLTARDNPSKMGWEWQPVRESDRIEHRFGRPATEDRSAQIQALRAWSPELGRSSRGGFFTSTGKPSVPRIGVRPPPVIVPASDYCAGSDAKVYDRTIPLHALEKMGLIEREFGTGRVAFMITDYVTLPHAVIEPDPFLMAVVPNKDLAKGVGRFVIDVWNEPGFGIALMLK